mmetsp:Transcript_24900/g.25119  ORF Transcript_24900/g.25119 Transcript_24900/m.25119 type:complete len:271 (+) Transcript_24900:283-1095(+)|eukprot:CAMPEP_0182427648 /NCGR_PEP_ID=MMETSP1167-20130531/18944_1 /TAXON_ID=2988 /ORGANISM="Mallomonas Sp, Strain CCMP3275" /LENGTH=270 /DNA_ID=CAMNT_0024610033 /DNA_START=263 /DNA_END=1075 /DNA_ORIENTATION=+
MSPSQNYGQAEYWDERYERDESDPFDWLVEYADISELLSELIKKDDDILMTGCGNAPFSVDMHLAGYTNITNIDISSVVIGQQSDKYPQMKWLVMDVHNLSFENESISVILDKSLIDTVLCYSNSVEWTHRMIQELYRVLKPNGRFITLSLHSKADIACFFQLPQYDWTVSFYEILNPRWDQWCNSRRSMTHTLIICEKHKKDPKDKGILKLNHVLTDKEIILLKTLHLKVNSDKMIKLASTQDLLNSLDEALLSSVTPQNLDKLERVAS